jgi:hypothetical protein
MPAHQIRNTGSRDAPSAQELSGEERTPVNQHPGQKPGGHTGQSGTIANGVRTSHGKPPQDLVQGPPRRDVPPTHHAPVVPVPGSVGSQLAGQGQRGEAQQHLQQEIQDHDVENALRGFLGK